MPATNQVPEPPEDTITRLRFVELNRDRYLLAASWDSTVRLWGVFFGADADEQPTADLAASLPLDAPVLDACCLGGDGDSALVAAGLVGGAVELLDLEAGRQVARLGDAADDGGGGGGGGGHHQTALAPGARCVEWLAERGLVAVAGWDASLRLFDPRAGGGGAQVARCPLPGKALAACVLPGGGGDRIAVATTGRHLWTYDARAICDGAPPLERAQTALKGQVRALACWGGGGGGGGGVAAAAGVEGKVAVFGLGMAATTGPAAAPSVEPFAFKCHRGSSSRGGAEPLLPNPVHCVAFHPRTGALLTGGADGSVACWDVRSKKRLAAVPLASSAAEEVVALAASADSVVAVGLGSAVGAAGGKGAAGPSLVLARLSETEVTPREGGR